MKLSFFSIKNFTKLIEKRAPERGTGFSSISAETRRGLRGPALQRCCHGAAPVTAAGGTRSSSVCSAKSSRGKPPATSGPQPPRLPGSRLCPTDCVTLRRRHPPASPSPRSPQPSAARGHGRDGARPCAAARGPGSDPTAGRSTGAAGPCGLSVPAAASKRGGAGSPGAGPRQRWGDGGGPGTHHDAPAPPAPSDRAAASTHVRKVTACACATGAPPRGGAFPTPSPGPRDV